MTPHYPTKDAHHAVVKRPLIKFTTRIIQTHTGIYAAPQTELVRVRKKFICCRALSITRKVLSFYRLIVCGTRGGVPGYYAYEYLTESVSSG